jgi:hypothetical protein
MSRAVSEALAASCVSATQLIRTSLCVASRIHPPSPELPELRGNRWDPLIGVIGGVATQLDGIFLVYTLAAAVMCCADSIRHTASTGIIHGVTLGSFAPHPVHKLPRRMFLYIRLIIVPVPLFRVCLIHLVGGVVFIGEILRHIEYERVSGLQVSATRLQMIIFWARHSVAKCLAAHAPVCVTVLALLPDAAGLIRLGHHEPSASGRALRTMALFTFVAALGDFT